MAPNKQKLIWKKSLAGLILLSFVFSYFPIFAKKSEAFFPVVDIKVVVKTVVDGFAMGLAQKMVDDIVKSSIKWANTGFDGSPAFVQDPERYFTNIADGVAGEFIQGSDLGFLCSPFQAQIKVSLVNSYEPRTRPFQCTITEIGGNIENFYDSFEGGGGWGTWFEMTQNNSNNPYGAYLDTSEELDERLTQVIATEQRKLNWGDGFRSKGDCKVVNPDQDTLNEISLFELNGGDPNTRFPRHDLNKPAGACLEYGPDKTPGSIIKSQLDQVLPTGIEKLITVEHVEQLVGAFTKGLLNRYVFGPKGLFSSSYGDHLDEDNTPPTVAEPPPITPVVPFDCVANGSCGTPGGDDDGEDNKNTGGTSQLNCSANVQGAVAKQDLVRWTASSSLTGDVTYSWTGDELPISSSLNVSVIYQTSGTKIATITAVKNVDGSTTTYSQKCSGSVSVVDDSDFGDNQ